MILTLLRLLDPSQGSIKIDNQDLSLLPREIIRSRLTCIPQDAYFFSDSVRANLDPTSSISDIELVGVLEKVGLRDTFGEEGLDKELDSKELSQGQKQLFSLARAMVRPSKVVILDEISSR